MAATWRCFVSTEYPQRCAWSLCDSIALSVAQRGDMACGLVTRVAAARWGHTSLRLLGTSCRCSTERSVVTRYERKGTADHVCSALSDSSRCVGYAVSNQFF